MVHFIQQNTITDMKCNAANPLAWLFVCTLSCECVCRCKHIYLFIYLSCGVSAFFFWSDRSLAGLLLLLLLIRCLLSFVVFHKNCICSNVQCRSCTRIDFVCRRKFRRAKTIKSCHFTNIIRWIIKKKNINCTQRQQRQRQQHQQQQHTKRSIYIQSTIENAKIQHEMSIYRWTTDYLQLAEASSRSRWAQHFAKWVKYDTLHITGPLD